MINLSRIPGLHGRIGRLSLAAGLLGTFVAYDVAALGLGWVALRYGEPAIPATAMATTAALVLAGLFAASLFARRLHDLGRGAGWVPAFLAAMAVATLLHDTHPTVAGLLALAALCLGLDVFLAKGQGRENLYGPVPAR